MRPSWAARPSTSAPDPPSFLPVEASRLPACGPAAAGGRDLLYAGWRRRQARRRHSAARPKAGGKIAFFPRNVRPYGLKREAFQAENILRNATSLRPCGRRPAKRRDPAPAAWWYVAAAALRLDGGPPRTFCGRAACLWRFSRYTRAGEGMGGLGGRPARTPFLASLRKGWALPRRRRPKGGSQAVSVRRRRSLTDIDSRARASPSPQTNPAPAATERRPAGPCPLGDAGALRASTAERGVPLPPSKQ